MARLPRYFLPDQPLHVIQRGNDRTPIFFRENWGQTRIFRGTPLGFVSSKGRGCRIARLARYFLPDQPLHVIQRGNNRTPIFFAPDDYALFRTWLGEAAAAQGCVIHAYVLMTNHIHLVVTPHRADSLPRMMQSLGRRYVQHVNRAQRRSGTLWEGRYRATPIDAEAYFFACCRYVEENPVRAGMVATPDAYAWSSYRRNALGAADPLVVEHALYTALGSDAAMRSGAYRDLFRPLDAATLAAIRAATNKGWALGSAEFRARVTAQTGRRAERLPAGRKRRAEPPEGLGEGVAPARGRKARKMRV